MDGVIDLVVSDHSPAPQDLKCVDTGDFMKAWGGISSLQLGIQFYCSVQFLISINIIGLLQK